MDAHEIQPETRQCMSKAGADGDSWVARGAGRLVQLIRRARLVEYVLAARIVESADLDLLDGLAVVGAEE